ncbi:TonB-dependent receptor [Galbibacter sp. PAP.153]|uniref:SusC/RagA family TonB-linked outer membrane protein n=1 Tax=Galbibacter sp. PAP.153 TaxID=3104623 RepID=UPI00300AE7CA
MTTKNFKTIPTIVILFTILMTYGQKPYHLKGKITTQQGVPVPGANILIKGNGQGTVTDFDGNYTILVIGDEVLSITSIGLQSVEKKVAGKKIINIILPEVTEELNEVVVVGYATQKKEDLTGAVSSVADDLLKDRPLSSVDQLLQGGVAGVQVTQTSGQPGGGISVRIRGGGSIQGGNEPLYVIDGFPVYNNDISLGVVSGNPANPLSSLNPSDIASIDILKDASATAIYGSRGANGVVIITTKQGKEGKPKISYETSYGIQELRKKIGVMNASEFAALRNEALLDRNPGGGPYQYLGPEEIAGLGAGTDWQDAAFHAAPILMHQLDISGAGERTKYLISGNYFDQEGIIKNTGFDRISTRINLDTKINDDFHIGLHLTGSKTNNRLAPGGLVSALLTMPPTATIYDQNGDFTLRNPFENVITNPIASLELQTNKSKNFRVLGTVYGEYTLWDRLKLKVSLGTDINNLKEESYLPTSLYEGSLVGGEAHIASLETNSWLNENTLTYNHRFGKHSLEGLLGFTQQEYTSAGFSAGSQNFVTDALTFNNLGSGSVALLPGSNTYSWNLLSYLGRINYNYDQRYFITTSFRADGSSKFGKNNKWGYFPSIALAWRISNERFFEPLSRTINNLKLRLSYGMTGNQEIGVYQSLSTLSAVRVLLGSDFVTGFTPDRIANSDLGWETTKQADIGFDLGLLKNRISLTLDAYYKKTEDLLLNVEIPWTSGYGSSLQNYGAVENKGLEVALNTINFQGDFNWSSGFNISFNRNKVLTIGDGDTDYILGGNFNGDFIIKEGEPLGSFYGAVSNGILQPGQEAALGALTGRSNPKPGDRIYKDIDGDGTFSTAADREIIGNAQPDYIFGFTNTWSYNNIDLNILLQGSVGNEIINGNRQTLELLTGQQNASSEAVNRWAQDNTGSNIPRASADPSNIFLDRFVEDGSYLRVKSIVLGYTVPGTVTSKFFVNNLRFYVTAQNLLTWTKYTGFDPEVTSAGNTITKGYDAGIYPVSRSISAGLKVTF